MSRSPRQPSAVVLAKLPEPGRVKTRLVPPLSPEQAAAVHELFLRHTLERLLDDRAAAGIGRVVLCVDPPGAMETARERYGGVSPDPLGDTPERSAGRVEFHPQSAGDLGARLASAMEALGADRPVLFLGCDSPDLPGAHLVAAAGAIASGAGIVLGPCDDGGFWCLGVAAGLDLRPILRGVEWSSGRELGQVRRNATAARLSVTLAPGWVDVDRPHDLANLLVRLRAACGHDRLLRRLLALGLDATLPQSAAPAPPARRGQ